MKIPASLAAGAVALSLVLPAWAMPIPEAHRVTVNGVTWAQLDLFPTLTWGQIDAQCPHGVCASGRVLGQMDMAAWTWAGPDEVAALFNYYLANAGVGGSDLLDPSNLDDAYEVYASWRTDWVKAVMQDFRYTAYDHQGGYYLHGWVAESPGQRYMIDLQSIGPDWELYRNRAAASSAWSARPQATAPGAWFFCADRCPPLAAVPAPSALPLFLLAFSGMLLSGVRRAGRRPGGHRLGRPRDRDRAAGRITGRSDPGSSPWSTRQRSP